MLGGGDAHVRSRSGKRSQKKANSRIGRVFLFRRVIFIERSRKIHKKSRCFSRIVGCFCEFSLEFSRKPLQTQSEFPFLQNRPAHRRFLFGLQERLQLYACQYRTRAAWLLLTKQLQQEARHPYTDHTTRPGLCHAACSLRRRNRAARLQNEIAAPENSLI